MSDWMWLSIGILEMTMVIADEITNQRFRWLLRKHFISWHIRPNLASNIKSVARASESNASEEKK